MERMSILEFGQRCQYCRGEHLMGERFRTHRRSDHRKPKAQLEIEYPMTKRRQVSAPHTRNQKFVGSTTMETTSTSSIHTAMPTLKGKRVFITGGTTGIGRAIANLLDQKAQKFSPAVGIKRN